MAMQTATHPHHIHPVRSLGASALFLAMLLAALSLWTAIPIGWLYVGSKVSATQFPSSGPYAVVGVGILVTVVLDAWLIGRLNSFYVRLTGTNRLAPMRPSWLKSMRDTRGMAGTTTVVEAVMISSVMLAAAVFVVWFFLLAGSPLPSQ